MVVGTHQRTAEADDLVMEISNTCRVVKKILSSSRIRESRRHVFPGGAGSGRHITIDINSSIQVSSSCQT